MSLYFSLASSLSAFIALLVITVLEPRPPAVVFVIAATLFIFSFLLLVYQILSLFKLQKIHQIEIQKYKYLENEIKFYRQHRHDLKNHLIIMYELARLGKTEDLRAYASEFMERTDQSLLTLQTGNQELDVLLYSKLDQARQNLVEVDVHSTSPLNIHSKRIFNVISIVSNLFDNAIEACIEIDNPDDRSITLSMEKDLFSYSFIVTNTFDPKVQSLELLHAKNPSFGFTHKKDKKAHGMGLKIVQSLVHRLEGKVQIDIYNQQFFQVKVTLPIVNLIQ